MAHYKRGKCRYHYGAGRMSDKTRRKHYGMKVKPGRWIIYDDDWEHPYWYNLYSKSPRWHRIIFHHRKHRSATREIERKVLTGKIDADGAVWPDKKKPVIYYW